MQIKICGHIRRGQEDARRTSLYSVHCHCNWANANDTAPVQAVPGSPPTAVAVVTAAAIN